MSWCFFLWLIYYTILYHYSSYHHLVAVLGSDDKRYSLQQHILKQLKHCPDAFSYSLYILRDFVSYYSSYHHPVAVLTFCFLCFFILFCFRNFLLFIFNIFSGLYSAVALFQMSLFIFGQLSKSLSLLITHSFKKYFKIAVKLLTCHQNRWQNNTFRIDSTAWNVQY